jgi:predicted nucleotidyltransferase component of viral defense system
MMVAVKRSHLSKQAHYELSTWLHMELLRSIVTVKRWGDAEMVFHGGTSLRLGFGSDRYSEDLDFMVNPETRMESLMKNVHKNLQAVGIRYFGESASIRMKSREDGKNPLVFTFSLEIPDKIGAVKVKTEFWQTEFLKQYETQILRLHQPPRRINKITLQVQPVQFHLPTERQIFADKVFAVMNRPYLKHRDLYDLYWLRNHTEMKLDIPDLLDDLVELKKIYPGSMDTSLWGHALNEKIEDWSLSDFPDRFFQDMQKWLPNELSGFYDPMFFTDAAAFLVKDFKEIHRQVVERFPQVEPSPKSVELPSNGLGE